MKPEIVEELKRILGEMRDSEDVAEVERAIADAKGKISPQPARGYWEDRTPCWDICHCPETIRDDCPAYTHQSLPCWAIEGTYCKLSDYGTRGDDTSICKVCRVYKRFGAGEPIELQLFGRGMGVPVEAAARQAGK